VENLRRFFFNPEVIGNALPTLLREGIRNTLILAVGAVGVGLVFGLLLALVGISRRWWVRLWALVYIDIFRGLPAILTISLIGFGLPIVGFRPFGRNTFAYAILALGLISTAYIAEIFRAGIQSIDKGQMEAARSVGMGYLQAMRLIIIPQAVRRVLPPLTNEFIAITKDTSLIFVLGTAIGQRELFRIGQNLAQQTGNYSNIVAAGLCYLIITIPLTRLVNFMDRRMREGKAVQTEELPAASGGTVPGGHL
jgi:polar amino acid transport system permease protein